MAKLSVLKGGQLILEKFLEPGTPFLVGRSSSAQVQLENEAGISREHFEILYENSTWILRIRSKFGLQDQNGDTVSADVSLKGNFVFRLSIYEFHWNSSEQDNIAGSNKFDHAVDILNDSSDKTAVGILTLLPYLKVINPNGNVHAVFKLEGESWIAGRDSMCSLFIDNPKFSRRHFEISRQGSQFFIRDLGSANGTRLNGSQVLATESVPIKSGDAISVADWILQFEVRDTGFEERVQGLHSGLPMVVTVDAHLPQQAHADPRELGQFYGSYPPAPGKPPSLKDLVEKNRKLVIYGAVGAVILVLAFVFSGEEKSESDKGLPSKVSSNPMERLTLEQKDYVRQSYTLGQQLLMQGKYELARQEMIKIHQLVPSYEDSKQIEEMADTAVKTLKEKQLIEAREKESQESERKILVKVSDCRNKIQPTWDHAQLEACLSSVLALGPDHPEIQALRNLVEKYSQEKHLREVALADRRDQERRLAAMLRQADSLLVQGEDADALKAYQRVVSSGLYDPGDLRQKARNQIVRIQKQSKERLLGLKKEVEGALVKKDLKTAVITFRKLERLGFSDATMASQIKSSMAEHRKIMQNLYQEAVLEESIGEVSQALAKWKKVIDSSYPQEEYFEKSRLKLSKYGVQVEAK